MRPTRDMKSRVPEKQSLWAQVCFVLVLPMIWDQPPHTTGPGTRPNFWPLLPLCHLGKATRSNES